MNGNYFDKNKKILTALLFAVYFAIGYILMAHFNITCIFLKIFGIPCPGCGMTRAFLSLLKLDISSAFGYNPLIFFMPYVFMYIFFDFKHRIHNVLLIIIAIIAVINWIIKIITFGG